LRYVLVTRLTLVVLVCALAAAPRARADEPSKITVIGKPAPPPAPAPPAVDDADDPKKSPPPPDPNAPPNPDPSQSPDPSPNPNPNPNPSQNPNPSPPDPNAPPGERVRIAPPPPGEGGIRTIEVPLGQKLEDVVPPTMITSSTRGIGEKIVELKILDNTRTLSNTVEYVSGLKIGVILTEQLIEASRLRLYSTGLFKDVSITWEPPSPKNAGLGVRVVVRALDKFPWVVAPIFSYQQRNYGGGAAFAHNNLLGRGIKLLLYADYTTAEKMFLGVWLDPSINNSPFYYRIDVILRRDNIVEYARGRLNDPRVSRATDVDTVGAGVQLGVNIARRFHIDIRLKLYYDWVRAPECFNTTNVDFSGTPDVVAAQGGYCRAPSSSGWDNTITTSMGWDGRSKVNGVQKGLQVTLTWQYGATWLGDNWNYHLVTLSAVYAFKFFKEHNLILRAGGDLDFDPPFKLESEVGSLDYTLRGSIYRQFRGDTAVRATVEYIAPLFKIKGLAVRAIGFFDTNLTWFRSLPEQTSANSRLVTYGNGFRNYLPDTPSGVARDSWNNGVGAGIRMYLRGVVLPLVGFDVGYGIEANSVRYYLSIGSVLD